MSARGTDEGRRRGHQTRVARSRAALVHALVELVDEDVLRGGTGLQLSPALVARRAAVSTSTLYNRFPNGIPEIASEAISRARESNVAPIAALAALAATHDETSRVRDSADGRLRAALAQLPLDPNDAEPDEIRHLENECGNAPEMASPDVAARVLLYLASRHAFSSRKQFAFAKKACALLDGVAGYEAEYKNALRTMVVVADTTALSHSEWVSVANAVEELTRLWETSDSRHWTWKLDAPLARRAVDAGPLEQINESLLAFTEETPTIPDAALSDRLVRGYAYSCSMAAQAGLLTEETIIAAAAAAYDLDVRLKTSSLKTLTSVYRMQLVRNAFASDIPKEEIFDPTEPHLPNAEGLLWAPFTVPLRRQLGMSSTPVAEKAFLENLADVLYITSDELNHLARELGMVDIDSRIEAAKSLDHLNDPAAALIHDLGHFVQELMVVQPQSEELRRRARNLCQLLQDELLEPVRDSLVLTDEP